MTLGFVEFTQLLLGYPDKGMQAGIASISLARRLNHSLTLCASLGFRAPTMILRREPATALRFAEECIAVAAEQGFPHWHAAGRIYRGWSLVQLGAVEDGIEQIRQGITVWRAIGANVALPWHFALLAESHLAAGQAEAAMKATDEALTWIDQNTEGQFESIAHRCRGDIFCASNDLQRACAEYEAALLAARRQEAKWWELRTAVRLAKLWGDQGKRDEARDLLAPVYGWFTEGFDTLDLKEAKALLDELAS